MASSLQSYAMAYVAINTSNELSLLGTSGGPRFSMHWGHNNDLFTFVV